MGPNARWTMGTSAPELEFHNHQSPMADIYSAGVLINWLCTQRPPPPAGTAFARLPDHYDPGLQRLIDECLDWDPLKRPTGGDMVKRLNRLKIAEASRINAALQADKTRKFQRQNEQFLAEQARKADLEIRAAERDAEAAAQRLAEAKRWKAHLALRAKADNAPAQVPGRAGGLTKEQRAAYLAHGNATGPAAAVAVKPVRPAVPEPVPQRKRDDGVRQQLEEKQRRVADALRREEETKRKEKEEAVLAEKRRREAERAAEEKRRAEKARLAEERERQRKKQAAALIEEQRRRQEAERRAAEEQKRREVNRTAAQLSEKLTDVKRQQRKEEKRAEEDKKRRHEAAMRRAIEDAGHTPGPAAQPVRRQEQTREDLLKPKGDITLERTRMPPIPAQPQVQPRVQQQIPPQPPVIPRVPQPGQPRERQDYGVDQSRMPPPFPPALQAIMDEQVRNLGGNVQRR